MRNPETQSINQKAVYDSIERPRLLRRLYVEHKGLMPSHSVRRILWDLKRQGMVEKLPTGKWRNRHE